MSYMISKKDRLKQQAELLAMIPDSLAKDGWKIGQDRQYHCFYRLLGPTYTLYGSTFTAQKESLKSYIWLNS